MPTQNPSNITDPQRKALTINLDNSVYGTIAEIGAGQETARWFFQAGAAAGTIAKALSAYDMTFSDSIYGTSPRYVSRERLQAMLDLEFRLLIERLSEKRGSDTSFFAFANTVATHSYANKINGRGWLGIRFQHRPGAEFSQIELHVNLFGSRSLQDQDTLGRLGLNLIYGATQLTDNPEQLLTSLRDGLYPELVEIDMVDFSGPAFAQVDNRLMALRLVEYGLSNAALFYPDGQIAQVADALWGKAVLVERSRFRPPTHFTVDLLDCAHTAFIEDTQLKPNDVMVLSEITLSNLLNDKVIDVNDYLNRIDLLCAMGKNVLISDYGAYYRLAQYLFQYTHKPIALVMGILSIREIFDEKYYEELPGGILESFGRLFKNDLSVYVSPALVNSHDQLLNLKTLQVADNLRHLFDHLKQNRHLRPLNSINHDYLPILSHEILHMIQTGDTNWTKFVPDNVAKFISERNLFQEN
ncbi:Nicotinamide mononucleotide adenylyltransferase [hydrothermal vent metagenome]|uniref:Nicotinamide mononucleotide adenylyltransferase n=1 Tax=hydrothermal vent metagenome TaxID=652676 RepID=A0A3B0ZDY7_9ZZZZ